MLWPALPAESARAGSGQGAVDKLACNEQCAESECSEIFITRLHFMHPRDCVRFTKLKLLWKLLMTLGNKLPGIPVVDHSAPDERIWALRNCMGLHVAGACTFDDRLG